MNCPSESVSAKPEHLHPDFGRDLDPKAILLLDQQVADILRMTVDWVRDHATDIPGFERLGQYYRFRPVVLSRWLGTLECLLIADDVAKLLGVPTSWVYANADQIPGVLRLGRYVRFRPRILNVWLSGAEACQ